MSADHNPGELTNPQSLNRYTYVLGDPVNGYDPLGLCDVLLGGITQSQSPTAAAWASSQGAISGYGYAGGSIPGGVMSVIAQGAGIPTGAALIALEAIALAAQGSGPIDIVAFSGGAQAFTSAYNLLSTAVQNRIASITYVDPGANGSLTGGNSNTSVYVLTDNSDAANQAVQLFASPPQYYTPISTGNCGHNLDCVIQNYGAFLAPGGSPCGTGAGGVFGAGKNTGLLFGPVGSGWSVLWWDLPLIPAATTTIRYDSQ